MSLALIEGLLSPTHLLIFALIAVIVWFRLARQNNDHGRG